MLKLEVNKIYVTQNRSHVKILVQDGARYVGRLIKSIGPMNLNKLHEFECDGSSLNLLLCTNLVEEYKPPVVHQRDILWYTYKQGGTSVLSVTMPVGQDLDWDFYTLLKRETVSYEEK